MNHEIALGADFGWLSQLESMGYRWADENGCLSDPVRAAQELGTNAARLRVFVNPPKEAFWEKPDGTRCMLGFCDAESILKMSRRIRAAGMRLLLDFHYSDHFADPQYQHIPEAWKDYPPEQMAEAVAAHTREVLQLLGSEGIVPDWVQVGNEINPGILLPCGSLKNHPGQMVQFLNAGYDAVKECCPDCLVITHTAGLLLSDVCRDFYSRFFEYGGKTDIIGLSYYPYWYRMVLQYQEQDAKNTADNSGTESAVNPIGTVFQKVPDLSPSALKPELLRITKRFGKPVMIVETGDSDDEPLLTKQLLADTIRALKETAQETGMDSGIFYWEPEVCRTLLPDHYPLGAARLLKPQVLQYTEALSAYRENQSH